MKPITIADYWKRYASFLPAGSSPAWMSDQKYTFYDGFGVCLMALRKFGSKGLDDDECVQVLVDLNKECDRTRDELTAALEISQGMT